MEFQEVTELVPGTKYKIIHHYHEYNATYKKTCMYNPVILFFSDNEKEYYHYIFTGYTPYKYYVPIFKRDHIQSTMEHRSLQLILKSIIGDASFSW